MLDLTIFLKLTVFSKFLYWLGSKLTPCVVLRSRTSSALNWDEKISVKNYCTFSKYSLRNGWISTLWDKRSLSFPFLQKCDLSNRSLTNVKIYRCNLKTPITLLLDRYQWFLLGWGVILLKNGHFFRITNLFLVNAKYFLIPFNRAEIFVRSLADWLVDFVCGRCIRFSIVIISLEFPVVSEMNVMLIMK